MRYLSSPGLQNFVGNMAWFSFEHINNFNILYSKHIFFVFLQSATSVVNYESSRICRTNCTLYDCTVPQRYTFCSMFPMIDLRVYSHIFKREVLITKHNHQQFIEVVRIFSAVEQRKLFVCFRCKLVRSGRHKYNNHSV